MQTGPKNSAPVPLELGRCISAIVTSLNNKLSSGASQEYRRSFDLGVIEWRIIFQLASERWSTGAQLSQAIGLDKAAVSRSLAQLKARQLVRFRPASGRRIEVALTQKGWATYKNVLPVALQRETRLLTGFTAAEVDQLVLLLHRLVANLPLVEADAQKRRATSAASPARRRLATQAAAAES